MGPLGVILLLVVVVCVVVLIVIANKRKKLEESTSSGTDHSSATATNKPVEEKKEEVQPSNQATIYEYCAANRKRLCAMCDGENEPSATHCHICGQRLN